MTSVISGRRAAARGRRVRPYGRGSDPRASRRRQRADAPPSEPSDVVARGRIDRVAGDTRERLDQPVEIAVGVAMASRLTRHDEAPVRACAATARQQPGVDGPGHLGCDAHDARTGRPRTSSTSAEGEGAASSSTTSTTPVGRIGAATARRRARKHGRTTSSEWSAAAMAQRPRFACVGSSGRGASAVDDDRPGIGGEQRASAEARPERGLPAARQRATGQDAPGPRRRASPSAGTSSPPSSQSATPAARLVGESEHRGNVTRKIDDERAGRR